MAQLALIILLLPAAHAGVTYRVVHNFGAADDGNVPSGPLFVDSVGNLYGVAGGPGQYGYGIAFELSPIGNNQWSETILHTFLSAEGSPWGAFVMDGAGNLYGTTSGADTNAGVYQLSPGLGGWNYSVVYSDGAGPGLVFDRAGSLYGNIGPGNYFSIGVIGELSPGTNDWLYSDLANFNPTVGYSPPAPPVFDSRGNLWGVTEDGGIVQPKCWTAFGCGVIFEMTPNGDSTWTYNIPHHFASYSTDGQSPNGGLVMGSGAIYGVTGLGGANNTGTVFQMTISNGGHFEQTVLYDFPNSPSCALGCYPDGTMALDKAGNLYGVASGGIPERECGGYTCGVVFRLERQVGGKWKYEVVHKFTGTGREFFETAYRSVSIREASL
jgi:hypothetical protein